MGANQMAETSAQTKAVVERLADSEPDKVSGGTKVVNHSSPHLFAMCATGKHFNNWDLQRACPGFESFALVLGLHHCEPPAWTLIGPNVGAHRSKTKSSASAVLRHAPEFHHDLALDSSFRSGNSPDVVRMQDHALVAHPRRVESEMIPVSGCFVGSLPQRGPQRQRSSIHTRGGRGHNKSDQHRACTQDEGDEARSAMPLRPI
jgi:hypothetical protein